MKIGLTSDTPPTPVGDKVDEVKIGELKEPKSTLSTAQRILENPEKVEEIVEEHLSEAAKRAQEEADKQEVEEEEKPDVHSEEPAPLQPECTLSIFMENGSQIQIPTQMKYEEVKKMMNVGGGRFATIKAGGAEMHINRDKVVNWTAAKMRLSPGSKIVLPNQGPSLVGPTGRRQGH